MHVDIDPASISKTVNADIPIVGDVNTVLGQFDEAFKELDLQQDVDAINSWWKHINEWRKTDCLKYEKNSELIKPQYFVEFISF